MARIRVVSGPGAGRTLEIEQDIVIGREGTDLEIDDPELSRRHAVVRRFANRVQVEDLGSTNGTFVDGKRIAEPTLLGGGAQIKLGTSVLAVEGVLPVTEQGTDQPRNVTRISPAIATTPSAAAPQAAAITAAGSSVAPPSGAATATVATPPATPPLEAVGEFRPPAHRRQRGLASRSWVPVALSFGTVILVAIALVIYFSQHT